MFQFPAPSRVLRCAHYLYCYSSFLCTVASVCVYYNNILICSNFHDPFMDGYWLRRPRQHSDKMRMSIYRLTSTKFSPCLISPRPIWWPNSVIKVIMKIRIMGGCQFQQELSARIDKYLKNLFIILTSIWWKCHQYLASSTKRGSNSWIITETVECLESTVTTPSLTFVFLTILVTGVVISWI